MLNNYHLSHCRSKGYAKELPRSTASAKFGGRLPASDYRFSYHFVLVDEGIDARVDEGAWQDIVDVVVAGFRRRSHAQSICRSVESCGKLIREYFPIKPDDTDELDNIIVED